MKGQSAIEFISVYGFMLIIAALFIALIVLFAFSAQDSIQTSQCSGFSGLYCSSAQVVYNAVASNSFIYLVLDSEQSAPVNIIGINVIIDNATYTGSCVPPIVAPAERVNCTIGTNSIRRTGQQVIGSYTINGQYCDSPIYNISVKACTYQNIVYTGFFSTYVTNRLSLGYGNFTTPANVVGAISGSFVYPTGVDIAEIEAVHAEGKNVIELGPGRGILTKKLCEKAKFVLAIEKDETLCKILDATMRNKNLELVNADFFKLGNDMLEKHKIDIMVANIPYNLSSKVIEFIIENRLQAVLCLQKEFVEHMLAAPGTKDYSRLSVMSHLCLRVTKILDVKKGNFSPIPRVDSAVIYVKPLKAEITGEESEMINLLMQHKKKRLRNAFIDSRHSLEITKEEASSMAEKLRNNEARPFAMNPEEILSTAREILLLINQKSNKVQ